MTPLLAQPVMTTEELDWLGVVASNREYYSRHARR
jgi:hypothetical protein